MTVQRELTLKPRPSVAIATICFDGFDDRDFADAFSAAPEVGISALEFNCWYPRTLTPRGIRSILSRCGSTGLRPATLQILSPAPGSDLAGPSAEVARWLWMIEAASMLGVDIVKTTGPRRADDGDLLGSIVQALQEVAPFAEERGVKIALENHFGNTFEFPDDYERLFETLPSHVGMCLDTGHFAASGVDTSALWERFADRIFQIDLKDCARSGAAEFVPFGEGIVDFDAVLSSASAHDFSGVVVVEYPRPAGEPVPLHTLADGRRIAEKYAVNE